MPTVYKIHPEIEKEWLDFSIINILKQSNSGKSWIEINISHQNPSYSICHIKRNIKRKQWIFVSKTNNLRQQVINSKEKDPDSCLSSIVFLAVRSLDRVPLVLDCGKRKT